MARIAVVEDEQPLARALERGLKAESFEVDLFFDAGSASEALGASGNSYDLILLDLMLPDGDGADVCSKLRAGGVRTPILALTARDSIDDKVDLLDRGADDFLAKPFSFEELLARSRALMRRASERGSEESVLGDLRVVPDSRTVFHAGKRVSLTAREFELLLYLMTQQGRIVGREELLSKVWKYKEPSVTNVVDVHVRNLRRKLKESHEHKHIQTIHGVGFTIR